MKTIFTSLILAMLFLVEVSAQDVINHTYPLNDGPDKNPMKGWSSGWWDDADLATVGFQYVKWKEFEPTDGNFNFNAVESVINRPGSANRHVILRLYTDWFGEQQESDAGPRWLFNDYGVQRLQSPGGKYITDYNDANYIGQVGEAISALASKYEDDPRVYAIQLGVLGYWGEWHTFSYNDDNFEIANTTMTQIIDTYKSNFPTTKLMGRYPWREPLASANDLGFHNDFFLPNNGHSDEFDDAVLAGEKWMGGPIGGEIPPVNGDDREAFMTALYQTSEGINMIEAGHYSTMKAGSDDRPCQSNPNGPRCASFMAMHRKMGYNYQIASASFSEDLAVTEDLNIELNITNIGVAPIYYDWEVQFALLDQQNEPEAIFSTPYNLSDILPGNTPSSISPSIALSNIPLANYKLAVRLIQPNADLQKDTPWKLDARNTYILFSNDLPVIDGAWDDDHALAGGWSILGDLRVKEFPTSANQLDLNNSISVYPSPTRGIITVKGDFQDCTVEVLSENGALQQRLRGQHDLTRVDISNLPAGIYFVNLRFANTSKTYTRKIIKLD